MYSPQRRFLRSSRPYFHNATVWQTSADSSSMPVLISASEPPQHLVYLPHQWPDHGSSYTFTTTATAPTSAHQRCISRIPTHVQSLDYASCHPSHAALPKAHLNHQQSCQNVTPAMGYNTMRSFPWESSHIPVADPPAISFSVSSPPKVYDSASIVTKNSIHHVDDLLHSHIPLQNINVRQQNHDSSSSSSGSSTMESYSSMITPVSHSSQTTFNTSSIAVELPASHVPSISSHLTLDALIKRTNLNTFGASNNLPPIPPQKKGNTKRKVDYEMLDDNRKFFLERNRLAAFRSRQKKKYQVLSLQAKAENLHLHNAQLQTQTIAFHNEIKHLEQALQKGSQCDLPTM